MAAALSVRDLDAELGRLLEEDTPACARQESCLEARITVLEAQVAQLDVEALTRRFQARVQQTLVDASLQAAKSVKRHLNAQHDTLRPHTR